MKIPLHKLPLFGLLLISSLVVQCGESDSDPVPPPPSQTVTAKYYLTKMDQSVLFAQQDNSITNGYDKTLPTLEVKKATTFQTMDGFGLALTGGSALHLSKMSEANRSKILTELFATIDMNIGISYLRISIGASDLDEFTFSYDDVAAGETDMNLEKFTIDQDRKYLIPVIKEILAINPDIKFMASPWSAPAWMKTNGATKGGSLKPECYEVICAVFVKYMRRWPPKE
jgi:glucosylceramidase